MKNDYVSTCLALTGLAGIRTGLKIHVTKLQDPNTKTRLLKEQLCVNKMVKQIYLLLHNNIVSNAIKCYTKFTDALTCAWSVENGPALN